MAENGWLREELANTQSKLCDAEQRATKAEEERAHYKEGFILISQFNSHNNREMINLTLKLLISALIISDLIIGVLYFPN